jgi:hypothetical protein
MPTDKDFKRLVRARMGKTGEAYTTARAHLRPKPTSIPTSPGSSPSRAATRTRPRSPGCSPPSASPTRPPAGRSPRP